MIRTMITLGLMLLVFTQKDARSMPLELRVKKTQIVNVRDEPIRLRGVNTACLEWTSDGEGHIVETVKTAINDWHVNVIRLPLNQDRWFGKAREQKDEGQAYRKLVDTVVRLCAQADCYVMLDLHWSDAGEWGKQIGQHVMPDQNSAEFWKSCATAYKNHPAVIFDLYNEPHDVTWNVWRSGGEVTEKAARRNPEKTFQAVGMQTLLDTIRATGAKNVIIAGGLDWAYDMSGFLEGKRLADPTGNGVIYANHAYPFKGDTVERWLAKMEKVTKEVPVIVSEFGSDPRGARPDGRAMGAPGVTSPRTSWVELDRLGPAPCRGATSDFRLEVHADTELRQVGSSRRSLGTMPPRTATAPASDSADREPIGIFENHGDVGTVLHPGSVTYDPTTQTYTLAGSGENMWSVRDTFHYVWKQAAGDLSLAADVSFVGAGREPHRKACLVIRQGLEADSAYVDVALHGDGLTSLQFREARGAATHEVQANQSAPRRLRIVKRGKYVVMDLARDGQEPGFSGAAVRIVFQEPFYVGLGVCAHNKDVTETAVFSNVELTTPSAVATGPPVLYSTLETQTISSTDRRVVHVTTTRIEAPNWLRDGSALLYNSGGQILRVPVTGGTPERIDTGFATRCNNDHGVSPDGTLLAISDQSQGRRQSLIYTLPITGGSPKLVTPTGPSYWHGWSPDGKTLAFCGERGGEFDIYTVPARGGEETRLTTAPGLDDGPEYSPDGNFIYFNSVRTGTMQIWRMRTDGGEQEPVTADEFNNWFPHVSPNGRSLVFLSYEKDVTGHPENKDVALRIMSLESKKIDVLGRVFGGQGTINVPCWSPDGRKIAFVTYQLLPRNGKL